MEKNKDQDVLQELNERNAYPKLWYDNVLSYTGYNYANKSIRKAYLPHDISLFEQYRMQGWVHGVTDTPTFIDYFNQLCLKVNDEFTETHRKETK